MMRKKDDKPHPITEAIMTRGSTKNDDRLAAFENLNGSGGAGWGDCSPDLIQAVVVGITQLGGAVIFGLSRDQGAHSVTLLLGPKKVPLWFNGDADLNDELTSVVDTLSQID